jgi:DNA repair protein SbcD/Mre11
MLRLLHLADVHLDTPFAGRSPALRARLRQASREAFGRAVEAALAERVHAVLVAGDLFDVSRLSFESEGFLLEQLRRLDEAGVAVIYATGNHDPGREGARTAGLDWPAGLTLAPDATPRRVPVRDAEERVLGYVTAVGHAGPSETRDLAAGFPRPAGALPEVALLHAQVVGSHRADAHRAYAPTTIETLRRAGYDYWALGHVHTRQEVCDRPVAYYPGNLQGRTHAESGPRGGLLVELGEGPPRVSFRPFAPVRWETLHVSGLEEALTLDAVVGTVRRHWQAARAADPDPGAEWMVRVVFSGGTPLWRELAAEEELQTLGRELEDALGALDVELRAEGLHAPVDVSEHRAREDALGVALRRLEAMANGEGALPADLEGELAGWDGSGHATLARYVASLLDDADGQVLARWLVPPGRDR